MYCRHVASLVSVWQVAGERAQCSLALGTKGASESSVMVGWCPMFHSKLTCSRASRSIARVDVNYPGGNPVGGQARPRLFSLVGLPWQTNRLQHITTLRSVSLTRFCI